MSSDVHCLSRAHFIDVQQCPLLVTRTSRHCHAKDPKSSAASVFHTGIYLGNDWFIESSNFFDGVTLANLHRPGWYYASGFAWGRQVLSPAQLSTATGN